MAKNKRFLDSNGVAYLWEKINLFFSQIGHRHETSDVNGLDEYMEENAKAIRDTEKVVEELSELPLYPTQEQLWKIYAYDGELYRAKKLNTLTLDFSNIPVDEETGLVTKEIFIDFINKNGLNIVNSDDLLIDDYGSNLEKEHNVLLLGGDKSFAFEFRERNNKEEFDNWNSLYIKGFTIRYQSNYIDEDEETYYGEFIFTALDRNNDDYFLGGSTSENFPPPIETTSETFGNEGTISYADSLLIRANSRYLIHSLTLQLATCASSEDYENNIFSDFLVWEKVSEEELTIDEVEPATEDTTKRFYREVENNNIYVTDRETELTPGGFEVVITHTKDNKSINNEELRKYIDPETLWTDYVEVISRINGDQRPYTGIRGEEILLTPIRIGTNSGTGSFRVDANKSVTLCFTPYIQIDYESQKPVWDRWREDEDSPWIEYDAPSIRWHSLDYNGNEIGEEIEISKFNTDYFLDLKLLDKHYTEITIPIGDDEHDIPPGSSVYFETVDKGENYSKRCHLYKVYYGNKETTYTWSQIAKVQDIHDAINALPEVARTGNYSDLFNKPCIGDVQTYDWPSNEDLPIIDEGTGNCDNRLKQLLRWNNSLYTAVFNESGLSVDLRDFSKKYNTQGYCGNKLRTYIFEDRIDAVSGAYQDYFVTGNTILIQNTKGIGMQIGSTNSYGEMLLAMRSEEDDQRYLFNNVEVALQSWSSDGEKTTDNANIYVEVGTTSYQESQVQRDVESELILFFDAGGSDWWGICKKVNGELNDLTPNELQNILDTSGNTLVINDSTHSITEYWGSGDDWVYCRVNLDNYNNLDENWARDEWNNNSDGYRIYFRQTVTEYEQVLTPQQTKNVWFKRYGDEYVEEWEETSYWTNIDEIMAPDDYIRYYVYDDNTGDIAFDFLYSLVENQVLKINGVEVIVKEVYPDDGELYIYYNGNEPSGYISILRRRYVNNPVLRETVSLQGTNCDYLKIWTQYDEDPEQYGRRGVIKTIMFNDLRYEYDPNPTYNRDILKKDYWKQISGNGSIKVIDLTGDE